MSYFSLRNLQTFYLFSFLGIMVQYSLLLYVNKKIKKKYAQQIFKFTDQNENALVSQPLLTRANNCTRLKQQDFRIYQKLDGVGPVDNRPSTD